MVIKHKTKSCLSDYFKEFSAIFSGILVSDALKKEVELTDAVERVIRKILATKKKGGKVMIIGNGGSASIASHMATDLCKNCAVRGVSFSDVALLTCVSNDFGYEHVFEKPIDMFADEGDLLIAISSSGESKNILNGILAAKRKGCDIVGMSGFKPGNKLRFSADINFYVPHESYGFVEMAHAVLCHFIVDKIIYEEPNG